MNNSILHLFRQFQGIWKQLGINQRLTIIGTGLLIVVGLGALTFWSSQHEYGLLYSRLEDAEAAKVIAALDDSKIPYKITHGGSGILIPRDKVHTTRMQLASKGVPKSDGVGFEIFDRSNFGISDFVQRANYVRALQGELSRTISQVDMIETARVMIVLPENRMVVDDKKRASASVFVKVRGNLPLPVQSVGAIRFLVANAVEGLVPDRVSVVDNSGNVLSDTSETSSAVGLSQSQLTARKNIEQYLARKAEGMLDVVLGAGQAVVRVSTDINFDSLTRTEEKYDPESQVLRSATVNDENTDTSTMRVTGGVPGEQTDSEGETNVVARPLNNNRVKKKVTDSKFEINKITSNLVQGGGEVTRVAAAVFIAARMEGTGAERKAVPRSKEEIEKLRRIVQTALGIQGADGTRKDEITLEEIPFNEQPTQELNAKLESQEKTQFWVQVFQMMFYPGLAVGALALFWRGFRKAPDIDIPLGVPIQDLQPSSMNSAKNNGATTHSGLGSEDRGNKVVTVDVLNQLIRKNPQNMTAAIRTWMTRGKR